MYSKSGYIEIMINEKSSEDIGQLFQSLLSRYQIWLETSMKGSDFVFDYIYLLYCKCHKTNFNNGRSYISSPNWIISKKATKNSKYFQYAVAATLIYDKLGNIVTEQQKLNFLWINIMGRDKLHIRKRWLGNICKK